MIRFDLPDLGEGLQEAEIVAWHVAVGDHVVADQPLVSVETDKAVVEIPSPQAGQIARLCAEPGDIVRIGGPLVEFDGGARADSGTVVGTIETGGKPHKKAAGPSRPVAKSAPSTGRAPKAAPAVRALAERLGVDLAVIEPSGPDNTITAADVEAAASGTSAATAEPVRGVRRAMAINMERAHREVVPATVTDLADIGDWEADADPTIRLVRAVVCGCRAAPVLNAWYLGRDKGRAPHATVDLGIAMETDDGLFVPVLRDVGSRQPADLRRGLDAMAADVRKRSVPAADLRGQTITISNFGMFGGRYVSLVVMPPQVAILGAGRIHESVVARDGKPSVRRVMPLSLTFDHRAATGAEAARFLAAVIADLERDM